MYDSLVIFFQTTQWVYLLYLVITNSIAMMFIYIALKFIIKDYFNKKSYISDMILSSNAYKPISILAPAFNEEMTITSSVKSLLSLDFPTYEVVIINDGSTDKTLEKLMDEFELQKSEQTYKDTLKHQPIKNIYHSTKYKNLIVIDKENGGKADALNCGINVSKYELFCCVDADSKLETKAITRAVSSMMEQRDAIAVGGTIGVINDYPDEDRNDRTKRALPDRLVEKFQSIEYLRGFLAGRIGWTNSNGLLIVSGAFGIFKKDIVLKIGGYRKDTIGEDFDLVVRMRKYCYEQKKQHKVLFVPETLCWTQIPDDYESLLKQRNRWHKGLIETMLHNKEMLFNPKYGVVGMLSLPYFLLIEAGGPIITFMGVCAILVLYYFHLINHDTIILFFMLEFIWGILLNVFALFLNVFTPHPYTKKGLFKLILVGFIEPFFYKPLLKVELFIATFDFKNKKWNKPKRSKI